MFCKRPWRAFTWLCAFLQEHNLQESLETSEAVDLQLGASHFVNTLWLATQSRAFTYRYAEIQPGGFLKDHIQMPIHIDFPAHCPDEVHLQDLTNEWRNEGLGQYFMDEKTALVCHLKRDTEIDGPRSPSTTAP